jgi:hypothetical protein
MYAEANMHYEELTKAAASPLASPPRKLWRITLAFNRTLEQAFETKKREIEQRSGCALDERWVFHGTASENIDSILCHGFMVGGQGVTIRNGAAYGKGVYTGIGPSAPLQYGQNRAVILALSVCGTVSRQDDGLCDAWDGPPGKDWRIFREGSQLLPVYVLNFD